MMEWLLVLLGLPIGLFLAVLAHQKKKAPVAVAVPTRLFDVYRARSVQEWEAFAPAGTAAVYCPLDGKYPAVCVAFNADAWPARYPSGIVTLDEALSAARAQDLAEGRPPNRLIEDFILHEVAGHHFLKVGADHDSPNTLMNERNGPKTEGDRQALRDVLAQNLDGFFIHAGVPGA